MILRDRDTTGNGTLDERLYYLQNWRSDLVALITDTGDQREQVQYEPYGTPFGLPAGDLDASGAVVQADVDAVTAWYNGATYDVRGDLDMDNDVDMSDITYVAAAKAAGDALGLYQLSLVDNRKGYAGYELLAELSDAKWDVRHRVLNSRLGRWDRRVSQSHVLDNSAASQQVHSRLSREQCRRQIVDGGGCDSDPVYGQRIQELRQEIRDSGCQMPAPTCSSCNDISTCGDTRPNRGSATGCPPRVRICYNNCEGGSPCATLVHELVHAKNMCNQCGPDFWRWYNDPDECLRDEMEGYCASGDCGDCTDQLQCCYRACASCVVGWFTSNAECEQRCDFLFGPVPAPNPSPVRTP